MRLFLFILLLFSFPFTSLSAQEITKKRGRVKVRDEQGHITSKGKVRNYKKTGKWMYYDAEGRVVAVTYFTNDTINGPYTEYSSNGVITQQGQYKMNNKTGQWNAYDPTGRLMSIENFEGGLQHGTQRFWFPNGQLRDSVVLEHGVIQFLQSWHQNGKQRTTETYQNGLAEGRWKVYPENPTDTFAQTVDDYHLGKKHGWHYSWNGAKLIEAYHYADGLPDGTFTRYEPDGEPEFILNYSQGKLHGTSTYFKEGKKLKEENYFMDWKDGVQTEYDRNERVSKRAWYVEGILDSTNMYFPNGRVAIRRYQGFTPAIKNYTEWDSAGHLLMQGNMRGENRDGEWKTYYPDGKVRSVVNYNNGKLLGLYTKYYRNGKKMIEINYLPDGRNTQPDVWYENGKIVPMYTHYYSEVVQGNNAHEIFSDPSQFTREIIGEKIPSENELWPPRGYEQRYPEYFIGDGNIDDTLSGYIEIYNVDDVYPGGSEAMNKFISENIVDPRDAKDQREGIIYIEYIIETDGAVSNIAVKKSFVNAAPDLDAAAVNVVQKFPKHIPPLQNGQPVRARMIIPIRFTLR